ncbi:MAG TPA: hypothetical protein VD858_20520 [Reyranella sp.]|nr:hypothetical protein [Reyranella sp.]
MTGDTISLPFAHETWFLENPGDYDWSFLGETATLALLGAALALTLAVRFINRFWDGTDIGWVAAMAPYIPFAIRLHLAVSLIGLLSLGYYLSPAMDLATDVAGIGLGAVMAVVAIAMATGYRSREAAWLLIAAGPIGMLEFGVDPVLQRIDVLGLAAFIVILGPGRWSADVDRGAAPDRFGRDGRLESRDLAAAANAILALRVGAGSALIFVALYEKLINPQLALDFLVAHPDLQVAHQIGLPLSDLEFVRLAGAIEVLFGMLLISGALPQAIILIAGIPFNATLWFFGINELVGHLPIYGAMLAIFVFGSHRQLRPVVYGWGRTSGAYPHRHPT